MKAQAVTDPQASPPSSELCLHAELSQLAAARTFARQAAAAYGFDGDGCYEFAYAVNEAVTGGRARARARADEDPDGRGSPADLARRHDVYLSKARC